MTQSGGTWTENILYNFNANLPDAQVPNNVAIDASGNLYGSAYQGGTDNDGAVFELNPSNIVPWPETVIYSFTNSTDGGTPFGNAVDDGKGNVFAASAFGGSGNYGTLIELTPSSSGWSEKTLLSFNGTDGKTPQNLTLDSAGNVYGSTLYGGSHNSGVLFEVTP